jgi:hypothetical protein
MLGMSLRTMIDMPPTVPTSMLVLQGEVCIQRAPFRHEPDLTTDQQCIAQQLARFLRLVAIPVKPGSDLLAVQPPVSVAAHRDQRSGVDVRPLTNGSSWSSRRRRVPRAFRVQRNHRWRW